MITSNLTINETHHSWKLYSLTHVLCLERPHAVKQQEDRELLTEIYGQLSVLQAHIHNSHFTNPLFEHSQYEYEIGQSNTII